MHKWPTVCALVLCAVTRAFGVNDGKTWGDAVKTARAQVKAGNCAEARALLSEWLDGGAPIVDALREIRATYRNREEPAGFAFLREAYAQRADKLSQKDKIRFWNDYGTAAYRALSHVELKRAAAELTALGAAFTAYGGRPARSLAAFEELKNFPRPESSIRFPDSIKDFGDPMTSGVVRVAKDFGFDPVNATAFFQKALDSGASRIIVENVGKPWYIRPVKIRSNTELVLEKGVRIHMDRTWKEFGKGGKHPLDSLFIVNGVSNVVVKGERPNDTDSVIGVYHDLMDRARHCKTYGYSAFTIQGCSNVCLKNLRIADNSMDGVLLDGFAPASHDVYLENLDLDSNFRQACSLVSVNGLYCKRVKFRRTAGAEPLAGIDMEPAEVIQANAGIYLFDCEFDGNMGGGLLFSTSSFKPITVYAKRCTFKPQSRGAIMVFIRYGIYMGRNITVPGKALFEDCDIQGYSDLSPILIEGCSLIDLAFKNCRITDSGKLLNRLGTPDASVVNVHLNNDVWYSANIPDDNAQATISFENVTVTGYTNAPPICYKDEAGHYSVRNWKGAIDFNGKKINVADYRYEAPDLALADLPQVVPSGFAAPAVAASDEKTEHPFTFRYDGNWWNHPPDYTYLFYGKKGARAAFTLRYTGWVPGDKTIRLTTPSGAELKLGEFKVGDNAVRVTFPETGWYSFHPPARHVLVDHAGVDLCYYAGTSKERKSRSTRRTGTRVISRCRRKGKPFSRCSPARSNCATRRARS